MAGSMPRHGIKSTAAIEPRAEISAAPNLQTGKYMADETFRLDILKRYQDSQRGTLDKLLSITSNRVFNEAYDTGHPKLHAAKAYGCHLEDGDGNRYIDLGLAAGTAILGHAHPLIAEQVSKQLARGSVYTIPNFRAHEFAEQLQTILPWFGGFVFCNSGAEATMRAIRIARAYTGKMKIGVFSGGWHGAHDLVLVDEDLAGDARRPKPYHKAAGIPEELLDQLVFLPYNDAGAFDLIRENKDQLAMVLIEPSQGSNPRDDVAGFLGSLRQVTAECDVLLGFDEVITGFRLALGGAQELLGLRADLATYGKVVGGGLPIGMIAGRADVMSCIRNGSSRDKRPVFMGGTFSANPVSIAAGLATVRHLAENRGSIYPELARLGGHVKESVNNFCVENRIPVRMIGVASMFRLIFTDYPVRSRRERDEQEMPGTIQDPFYTAMLLSGVHVGSNRINFLSTAHAQETVEFATKAFLDNLALFQKAGYFGRHS